LTKRAYYHRRHSNSFDFDIGMMGCNMTGGTSARLEGSFNMQTSSTGGASVAPAASESHLVAALGTKWAHCVNTRLLMEVCLG